jgi:hypothetical protein
MEERDPSQLPEPVRFELRLGDSGLAVEIVDVPEVLDMSEVLAAALSSGAGAVRAVAERSGPRVEVAG